MQPKVDYCFKEIMKDMEVLKGFLSAVLNINPTDIKSIDLKPTELRKLPKDDKFGINSLLFIIIIIHYLLSQFYKFNLIF